MTAYTLRPSAQTRGVLSLGEARILVFSAAGLSRDETAELLNLDRETVKRRWQVVQRKLGARNASHAIALAFAHGLLTAEDLDRATAYPYAKAKQ